MSDAGHSEPIRIIITGGTFDKDYDPLSGGLTFRHSHLPEILDSLRLTIPVEIEINQLTDSLEMSDEDRLHITEACIGATESRIVVTHGTDTMVETARLLHVRLGFGQEGTVAPAAKTVVLTGAMVPHAVSGSDAVFNLGCALSAVQLLEAGVYVVMNGRVFPANSVRKDRSRGIFSHTDEN